MGNGLLIKDLVVRYCSEAKDYNKVVANYIEKLETGSVFDSSLNPDISPFTFIFGIRSCN